MKIKTLLFPVLFLFVHFSACKPKCNKYGGDINKKISEKFRIKIAKGDTLIYKTDSNKYDTLIVVSNKSRNSDEQGWYECDNGERYWRYFEEYNVFIKNSDSLNELQTISVLQKYPASMIPISYFAINNNLYLSEKSVIKTYILNDSIYNNVYTIKNDTFLLHYNIHYLVIDYQINNADTYYLNEYIKNRN